MKKLILFALFLIISIKIYDTHAVGMDIAYECISEVNTYDTYKITLKFYRDCEGISANNSHILQYSYTISVVNFNQRLFI